MAHLALVNTVVLQEFLNFNHRNCALSRAFDPASPTLQAAVDLLTNLRVLDKQMSKQILIPENQQTHSISFTVLFFQFKVHKQDAALTRHTTELQKDLNFIFVEHCPLLRLNDRTIQNVLVEGIQCVGDLPSVFSISAQHVSHILLVLLGLPLEDQS